MMPTGHIFIATSLDGFIARKDGSIDWLEIPGVDDEDHGFAEMMASVDGLIMGRGTFEKVLEFGVWPYEKPVIVLSRSLSEAGLPDLVKGKVEISRLGPKDLMEKLGGEGWKRAYVDGGKVIQSFLSEGLIADMTVTRIPVLIGEGIPLFGSIDDDISLEHIKTESYKSGLVSSTYKIRTKA